MFKIKKFLIIVSFTLLLVSNCKQNCMDGLGNISVSVAWDANHASDVNAAAGGGHKVYYSDSSGITKSTPNVITVPNTVSTNSATLSGLNSRCTYYVRVGAYSALNPDGGALSTETSINLP